MDQTKSLVTKSIIFLIVIGIVAFIASTFIDFGFFQANMAGVIAQVNEKPVDTISNYYSLKTFNAAQGYSAFVVIIGVLIAMFYFICGTVKKRQNEAPAVEDDVTEVIPKKRGRKPAVKKVKTEDTAE